MSKNRIPGLQEIVGSYSSEQIVNVLNAICGSDEMFSVIRRVRRHYTSSVPLSWYMGGSFRMVGGRSVETLVDYRLTAMEFEILMILIGRMRKGGISVVSQKQIAERLETTPASVSRGMKKLMDSGLVTKITVNRARQEGIEVLNPKASMYRVYPRIAFYGNGDAQSTAVLDFPDHQRSLKPPTRTRRTRSTGRELRHHVLRSAA